MKKLVLFDIDGTILRANLIGRHPIYQAIEEVCRQVKVFTDDRPFELRQFRMAGSTDTQIVHGILEGAVPAHRIKEIQPRIFDRLADLLTAALKNGASVRLFDGVHELISAVAKHKECLPGLLTGNNKQCAAVKLGAFALNPFFELGAFGNEAHYRSELPDIAVERAFEKTGRRFTGREIVIIGDTPNDVECGQHLGVLTIAVATGRFSREELHHTQPDYLFDDLSDTGSVMEAILS
jgi:phosphoglycolate phosphatase-like HAD superfamily hydrolase